jgi:hypothetical protein
VIYLAIDEIRHDDTDSAALIHSNFQGGLLHPALMTSYTDEWAESGLLKRAHVQAGEEL